MSDYLSEREQKLKAVDDCRAHDLVLTACKLKGARTAHDTVCFTYGETAIVEMLAILNRSVNRLAEQVNRIGLG